MLTDRVRNADFEHLRVDVADAEQSLLAVSIDPAGTETSSLDVTGPTPTHRGPGTLTSEPGPFTTSSSELGAVDSTSNRSVMASAAIVTRHAAAASSHSPRAAAARPGDLDAPFNTETPDQPQATSQDAEGAQQGARSYNFFDELDAKLADLHSPESGEPKS